MPTIRLNFQESEEDLSLHSTHCVFESGAEIIAQRGLYGAPQGSTFTWSAAVRGLAILLIRYARGVSSTDRPLLSGESGSVAASLDYAISKQPQWLKDMMGSDGNGTVRIRKLIRRVNPERKRPGPVELFVNPARLAPSDIAIVVNGVTVSGESELQQLEQRLCANVRELSGDGSVGDIAKSTTATPRPSLRTPEILFLFTTSLKRPYFSELLEECQLACENRLGSSYKVSFRAVADGDDFDGEAARTALLAEVERSKSTVAALVVVPTLSKSFTSLVSSISSTRDIPVIALTLPFHETQVFEEQGLRIPPVVMSDNRTSAHTLGAAVGRRLFQSDPQMVLRVLLIPGQSNRVDSIDRLVGFESGLAEYFPEFSVDYLPESGWSRDRAFETALPLFRQPAACWPTLCFAANDLMALGVRDAIVFCLSQLEIRSESSPIVFGYDAIDEVKRLIALRDQTFMGSVEQNLRTMSQQLASLLEQVLSPSSEPSTIPTAVLIEPTLILNELKF